MKNIKYFKYNNTAAFKDFLSAYGYHLENVKGFSFDEKEQYRGNILKVYLVHFDDGEYEYFKVVSFESFNEYHQSRLGFNGEKLLDWYQDADVRMYKVKDVYGPDDKYVITTK